MSKIDDISLTMTFELYMDLMWEESRIIINETSPFWGPDGSFMGSTNFVPKMWLPDIQIYMCKQFRKRQIVTDVAGLIIFKNRKVLYTVSTEVSQQERQRKDERVNVANLPKGNTLLWFNTGWETDFSEPFGMERLTKSYLCKLSNTLLGCCFPQNYLQNPSKMDP